MQNGLVSLGFRQDEITTLREADNAAFSTQLVKANNTINENWQRRQRTLVLVYYAGHGILKGTTYALCDKNPSGRAIKNYYPLEKNLREMGG